MIFVSPCGGHGTVYMTQRIRMAVRPDTVFGQNMDITKYPEPKHADAFFKRSGCQLNPSKTIEQNMVEMLEIRERNGLHTLLCGRCSESKPFLTDNKIKALCLIRHPLHAFVSYASHQHPEHFRRFGSFNAEPAIKFYAKTWNKITDDFIGSGNPIARFEYMPGDISVKEIREKLSGWDPKKRNWGEMDRTFELLLASLVWDNYTFFYGKDWYI